MVKRSLILLCLAAGTATAATAQAPNAAVQQQTAWTPAQSQEILDRTQTTRLAPDIAHLSAGERTAVQRLIEVGRIFQDVYEDQRHHQALAAEARLRPGSAEATLYRLFQGRSPQRSTTGACRSCAWPSRRPARTSIRSA
jgi:hypothetical protein